MDSKRRIALSDAAGIGANENAFLAVADGLIVVTKHKGLSEEILNALKDAQQNDKFDALRRWEEAVREAGLLHLSSREIDKRVYES